MIAPSHAFDIARARRETRAAEQIVHFNNAGAALMPIAVSAALHEYLRLEERWGGYETAERQAATLARFYEAAAALLHCDADEIAFAENATRAWDMAFYGFRFQPGDRILTTLAEYGSNVIAYLHRVRRCGVELVFVPDDEWGQIDVRALERLIDERVKLISISHIPTGGGLVNPAAEVGRLARAAGIPFLLDACQSIGQMPLDVHEIGCDILSGTGRKYLRGPRGTGLLYVRREMIERLEPPLVDQHAATLLSEDRYALKSDAARFEGWECNFAGKAALGAAIDYAREWDLAVIQSRITVLADRLRGRLADVDGVTVTDRGRQRCGIVTFTARQRSPADIKHALSRRSINVSVSSGSGSLVSFRRRGLDAVVRASVHYYNTEAEIDFLIEALQQTLG